MNVGARYIVPLQSSGLPCRGAACCAPTEYPTGGDTLDFTTVADKIPSTQIIQAFGESQNGNSGYYIPVQGSALNNWKLKCFLGGGTEITAGAYPASVTSDIVQLSITARKLL